MLRYQFITIRHGNLSKFAIDPTLVPFWSSSLSNFQIFQQCQPMWVDLHKKSVVLHDRLKMTCSSYSDYLDCFQRVIDVSQQQDGEQKLQISIFNSILKLTHKHFQYIVWTCDVNHVKQCNKHLQRSVTSLQPTLYISLKNMLRWYMLHIPLFVQRFLLINYPTYPRIVSWTLIRIIPLGLGYLTSVLLDLVCPTA